ncbi:MAG: sensor histidine kinase, partial [Lachnospiraceae bacterium]|nr:sensor histidine kinase [Lachnospiraceae bacterium]
LDMPGCTISCSVSLTRLHTKQLFMWITILSVALAITAFGFLLMRRRLRQEKEKNDLEYKMLQSQINPHFIYNTLNSIKWMATIQGSEGIAEMTTALAKLLKSLSKGSTLNVPIREELSLLKDYCTIQSYRYGGTVTVDIRVDDPSIEDCGIVKFTLQPLVENAIFHGIEPKGAGHIDVHLYREDEMIRIDVSDDGVGMSKEKAAAILTKAGEARSDFFRELGVYNVNRRLLFEYGEPAGITIDSTEGKGTTMTVRIPAGK